MKLLNLTVGGFKNIAETTVDLGGITAFVSPNNYGKSNLLGAIQFAVEFINASPRARSLLMGHVGAIPLVPELANQDFRFQIEFEDPSLGDYRYVRYGFSFSWKRDDGTGQVITDEILEINPRLAGRWTRYLRRDTGEYKRGHETRSFRSIQLDGNQLAIDVLTAVEDIEINPAIKRIKEVSFSLCAAIDASMRFISTPLEMAGASENGLMPVFDDSDLPRAMYCLKTNHKESFDNLLSALFTLFPEFEDIFVNQYTLRQEKHEVWEKGLHILDETEEDPVPFRIRDDLYRVIVKSAHLNQPVDISMMSTGTKRIVWLLTNVIIAASHDAQCIGIEEVETSIHPKMLSELLELLNEYIGKTSLLITSHSPFLIQYLKPRQIYVGVPNEKGVAQFKRIREDAVEKVIKYAYDRGLGFGEYLFELMSSEGDGAAILADVLEA